MAGPFSCMAPLMRGWLFLAGLIFSQAQAAWLNYVPDRRISLSQTEFGFFAFPIYSHLPGIGSTYGVGALGQNVFGTRTNLLTAATFGDLTVLTLGVSEVHLIPDRLIFSAYLYDARIPLQIFDRGPSSGRNDFFYNDERTYGGAMSLEFHSYERRVQLRGQVGTSRVSQLIRDNAGQAFTNTDRGEYQSINHELRLRLDLTDHFLDPRRGLRIDFSNSEVDYFDSDHSRFFVLSALTTAYVPMGRASTWAFHFGRSGAVVYDHNDKSAAQLHQDLNLGCSSAECQQTENQRVQERLQENQYGTALTLGGASDLRGYPLGRVRGSQSVIYGSEFRWNLRDENTPFNFGLMTGVRSVIQIAFFYEAGAAQDPPSSVLAAPLLQNYGVGFRYGFSGTFVRADVGFGSEGEQFTFLVGYPWEPSIF